MNRHRSFRVAAERCRVSQPALSMQIQKLEEILGAASAFEHGSGTTTTPTEPAPTPTEPS